MSKDIPGKEPVRNKMKIGRFSLFREISISKSIIYQMVLISAVMIGNKRTQGKELKITHHDLFLPENRWVCSNQ